MFPKIRQVRVPTIRLSGGFTSRGAAACSASRPFLRIPPWRSVSPLPAGHRSHCAEPRPVPVTHHDNLFDVAGAGGRGEFETATTNAGLRAAPARGRSCLWSCLPQSQLMDSQDSLPAMGCQSRERDWLARNTVLVAAALTSVAIIVAATIQY